MKEILLLHCTSSVIAKTLAAYLEDHFQTTEKEEISSLKAAIFDHVPADFMKNLHEHHPHVRMYAVLSPRSKIPTFSFPVRIFERPLRLKALKEALLEPLASSILALSEFKLYLTNRRLTHSDFTKNCVLTEKETDILAYLHQAYPNPVTREDLLKNVWQYKEDVTTHTLETHIYKLKQKLTLSSGENLLKTTDEGYLLNL